MRRFLLLIFLMSLVASVHAAKRKPATVENFEKIEKATMTNKDDVVFYKVTAEKYYSLFVPGIEGLMTYYKKLSPHLPVHLKASVDAREKLYKQVLTMRKQDKVNAYQAVQRVLTSFQKNQTKGTRRDQ